MGIERHTTNTTTYTNGCGPKQIADLFGAREWSKTNAGEEHDVHIARKEQMRASSRHPNQGHRCTAAVHLDAAVSIPTAAWYRVSEPTGNRYPNLILYKLLLNEQGRRQKWLRYVKA